MFKFYPGKLLCFLTAVILINSQASAQLTTYAGRNTYLGDGGSALNAGLFGAYSFAIDANGNIFIATYADNRVRRVDASTKIITTIAGTGIAGFSGDGGLAPAAQLNFNPYGLPGIAVDKAGNVFIGDYSNNRIRRIDAVTRVITTIAGTGVSGYAGDNGLATSAKLSGPSGMVFDPSGNLFFCDNNNSVVRRIDAATKIITTVAGNGIGGSAGNGGPAIAANLAYPECITLDRKGNLYISDEFNSQVRMVDAATGKISVVAGSGVHGYGGDGSAATSAALGYTMGIAVDSLLNVYIADQSNQRIRKVTAATGKISTIAGTGVAGFNGDGLAPAATQVNKPTTLLIDKAGNLYIDDMGNNRIRKMTTSVTSTLAGDGSDGFNGAPNALQAQITPQAVAADALGNVYIADGLYYDVRCVNIASSSYIYAGRPNPDPRFAGKGNAGNGGLATNALYNAPFGVAVDAGSNVYIADVYNNVIRKITYLTKYVTVVAGNNNPGFSGDGGLATAAQLNNPLGIAVDKTGNLYIADALNNRIRKVDASTQKISTIAGIGTAGNAGDGGLATAAQLNRPTGVAVDADGNVFILDRGNNSIRMIAAATLKISTVLNNRHVLSGVATDAAGNVFVSDSTASQVLKLAVRTYAATVVAGTGAAGYVDATAPAAGKLNYPGGLAVNSAGVIFVADINNFVVRKLIPSSVVSVPISNNIISTTDSLNSCTGKIVAKTITGSLPAGGLGTYTYQWLSSPDGVNFRPVTGAIAQSYPVGTTLTATTFYRRVVSSTDLFTDSSNIIAYHAYTNPVPVIKTSAGLAFCKGITDTLSTTVAYAGYTWSTGATTSQITTAAKGNFYVTVKDANGCSGKSASVSIVVNALPTKPTITANPTILTNLCPGSQAVLTSSASVKYAWTGGATTQSITVTQAGSYNVTITDANGCSNTSKAAVVSYKACGAPATVTATVSGTTATLVWRAVPCAVKYNIQYAVYGTTNWTTVTTPTADTTYTLTGLAASTKYTWQVSTACTSSLLSPYKNGTAFKTAAKLMDASPVLTTQESIYQQGFDAALFPNPATSASKLNLSQVVGRVSVMITDMSGRVVWKTDVEGAKQVILPSEKFTAGMYMVTVNDGKNKKVLKLVKQ